MVEGDISPPADKKQEGGAVTTNEERCAKCGLLVDDWEPFEREFQIHPTSHQFVPARSPGRTKEEEGT